ncbi:hypothetical protein CASFOL_000819 [Castilleja foliolosa]|uniref:Translin-associated protein X n=1 Tax=Castilleja foliolosa TaxID=1961234 RepID=A0ABD3EKT7_9LAMI
MVTSADDSQPSTMKDAFSNYASYLNNLPGCNYEQQKGHFKDNKEEVLEKAEKDLAAVMNQHVSRIVKELQGTDFWKLRRAYSLGNILSLDDINASLRTLSDPSIEPLQINVVDYLLGIADLTGELMRLAIGRISDGELEFAQKICRFVREIYRDLMLITPKMDDSSDMKMKMDVMLQSVIKIENGMITVIFVCVRIYLSKPNIIHVV